METAEIRFRRLAEQWFLCEPAYLTLFCSHALTANESMPCPIRSGQGRIEYNPRLLEGMGEAAFEELVQVELLRLFLKHPYERTPDGTPHEAMKIASDMVLSSHYRFTHAQLHRAGELGLPEKKHYEWYLAQLPKQNKDSDGETEPQQDSPPQGSADDGSDGDGGMAAGEQPGGGESPAKVPSPRELDAASAALWEEDEASQLEINGIISDMKSWGSIPGDLVQGIIANTRARIDYRKVLSAFRASVLSNERRLTRMQPNRRTGFAYMGSRRAFSTNLLLAVDVSGSISEAMLAHFYSVITKFFKYGIKSIDVIQFDTEVKGKPLTLEAAKKQKCFRIKGRGGTDFAPVFDYVEKNNGYDGLIILTDGCAPPPPRKPRGKTRVAWVCESEASYKQHHGWMEKLGRACYLNLK